MYQPFSVLPPLHSVCSINRGQSVNRCGGRTSALSQLNFGIDGFEFTAGIVDSHLPVDAALSGVDIV